MKRLILILGFLTSVNSFGVDLIPHKDLITGELQILTTKLSLNGRPFECLFDSGARHTMVQEKFIKDLTVVGTTIGGGISNPNQVTDLVNADLKLGEWQLLNATIGRTPRIPFECLVGNDFLIDQSFFIDMNAYKIERFQTDTSEFKKLNVYKSEIGGHFGFEISVDSQTIQTIFDTGASSTVIDLSFVNQHPEKFKLVKEIDIQDGNSAKLKAGLYLLDSLFLSEEEIHNVEVYALDLSALKTKIPNIQAIIGLNIIKNYDWFFDLPNKKYNSNKH